MRPYPRIRKTIKWGGASLTVLLVVVWIGSTKYGMAWISGSGLAICLISGQADIIYEPSVYGASTPPGWYASWWDGSLMWGLQHWQRPGRWELRVPLWPFVAVSLSLTIFAFRLDTLARRRDRMNLCPKCHYDRTGLAPDVVCPECGISPASSQRGDGR